MKAIILAGGGGTRLWPLSRSHAPKQLLAFAGSETLLQKTFRRTRKLVPQRDIVVAASERDRRLLEKQLPNVSLRPFSFEPVRRDTASAIGLAAIRIAHKDPKAVIFMVNADHVIVDEREYVRTARLAEQIVRKHPDHTVLVGIEPTYPETGYGYLKLARLFRTVKKRKIFIAERFIEKPPLKKAEQFVKKWNYLWNPAMFMWRVDHLLNLYRKHLPIHYRLLMKMQAAVGTRKEDAVIRSLFPKLPPVSIDFGIMEKLKKMLVIPASFGWADIGHWRTVQEMLESGTDGNTIRGHHLGIDTHRSLVFNMSGKLVATAGVSDLIVVATDDAVLVCHREKAQDVKKIVELIKKKKWLKYL
ncbi:MAG: sugar phosphate nucleotidyltransferase [Parcubacteria group bacterium]